MKHNRVVFIFLAVLTAIVLVISPVYAEDHPASWSVVQMEVPLVSYYDAVWCYAPSGLCVQAYGYHVTRIWREPYYDQYSYGCLIWQTWFIDVDSGYMPNQWQFLEGGYLCRGEVRPETDYTPQLGRYGIGQPPYSIAISASNNLTYTDKWYGGDRVPLPLRSNQPSINPLLPYFTMDSAEVGGEGSRPIQPTAINPPSKGKKPTPISYP